MQHPCMQHTHILVDSQADCVEKRTQQDSECVGNCVKGRVGVRMVFFARSCPWQEMKERVNVKEDLTG